MDTELLVPYGLNPEGLLVPPAQAQKDTNYICPACSHPLVLHAGPQVVRHFAHKTDASCNPETLAHKTAKLLLAQVITEQSTSPRPRPISLVCRCDCCGMGFQRKLPPQAMTGAREEVPIGDFVCDVVAYRVEKPVLVLEVLVTHAVDVRKANALPLPWAELRAEEILDNPYLWRPVAGKMNSVICPDCKKHFDKLKAVGEKWNLPIFEPARYREPGRAPYLTAIETCWKCKNEIPVYWWLGVPFCETEPPAPRPRTVQHRHSKQFGGSYWANTCPCCKSVQGDNFLFLGSKPVFSGLPIRDTPEMKAHRANATDQLIRHMFRNF